MEEQSGVCHYGWNSLRSPASLRNVTMKYALICIAIFASQAFAQTNPAPSCWVVSGATGYVMGSTPVGRYAAWWCPGEWGWSRVLLISKSGYTLKHPTIQANTSAASVAEAYWNANVSFNCGLPSTNDPEALGLCDAAYNASNETWPPSRWIVSPYPGATYRATYATSKPVDGVRTKTANGKVLIVTDTLPTECYCQLGRVVETSSAGAKTTYCAVAASAPQTVANCKLR